MTKFTLSTEGRKTKSFEPDIIGILRRGNPRIPPYELVYTSSPGTNALCRGKRLQVESASTN